MSYPISKEDIVLIEFTNSNALSEILFIETTHITAVVSSISNVCTIWTSSQAGDSWWRVDGNIYTIIKMINKANSESKKKKTSVAEGGHNNNG